MAGLRGQNMKPRQPSPTLLGCEETLAIISRHEELFRQPALHVLMQQQIELRQEGQRLRDRELRIRAKTSLADALHDGIDIGTARSVNLSHQGTVSAICA